MRTAGFPYKNLLVILYTCEELIQYFDHPLIKIQNLACLDLCPNVNKLKQKAYSSLDSALIHPGPTEERASFSG